MATSEEGSLNITDITTAQINKVPGFNTNVSKDTKAVAGRLEFDAAGLSGTQVLTETQSTNGQINISGAKAGTMTLEIDDDIKQGFWVRDETSDANATTFRPTGGSGVVLPKDRWIYIRARAATIDHVCGWMDDSEAGALSFAANYQVDAARPLKVRKNGQDPNAVGGMVHLEGAVEETTTNPVAGDTIVTLPQYYRPSHAVGFTACANPGTSLGNEIVIEIQTSGAIILRSLRGWGGSRINVPIDLSGICFFSGN